MLAKGNYFTLAVIALLIWMSISIGIAMFAKATNSAGLVLAVAMFCPLPITVAGAVIRPRQ